MTFAKNLLGGVAILIAAGLLGLAVNAVSGKPAKLILEAPKTAATTGAKKAHPDGNKTDQPASRPTPEGAVESKEAEVSTVPVITDEEAEAGELSMARVHWLIEAETIVLIDARGVGEYINGHLPGAINIPFDSFVEYYDKLLEIVPVDADVVAYCRSVDCDLSDNLARELRLMGYKRVLTYRGGIMEWEEAGNPIEKPK